MLMRYVCDEMAHDVMGTEMRGTRGRRRRRGILNFYAAFTRRFACRANTGPANHNGTSAQTHFANLLLAAFTLRLRTGKNQYYGNHNGSSAQTQCAHILAAAMTLRFAACHNHCFANHHGESRAPSGDHARRSPFCSL